LIENGADVNQADNKGDTPIAISFINGYLQIVDYLTQVKAHMCNVV